MLFHVLNAILPQIFRITNKNITAILHILVTTIYVWHKQQQAVASLAKTIKKRQTTAIQAYKLMLHSPKQLALTKVTAAPRRKGINTFKMPKAIKAAIVAALYATRSEQENQHTKNSQFLSNIVFHSFIFSKNQKLTAT